MAQRIVTSLVDDITGEDITDGETIQFAWKNTTYEIDLSTDNVVEFQRALEPYISSARRVGGRLTLAERQYPSRTAPVVDKEQRAAVREWALERGLAVSQRGRISAEIYEAYEKAHTRKAG